VGKTAQDVEVALRTFKTLKPLLGKFVYNNGSQLQESMLVLKGTVPLLDGSRPDDEVPVVIWIPKDYLTSKPVVFVKSWRWLLGTCRIHLGALEMNEDGSINLENFLGSDALGRIEEKGSSLVSVIEELIIKFSLRCELVSQHDENDEESEENGCQFDNEYDDVPSSKVVGDLDVVFRLFLCAFKRDGFEDVRDHVTEVLNA